MYLVCGVSGSGKTWVCKQVTDKFNYIPHDETYNDSIGAICGAATADKRPIITECPFAERLFKEKLEAAGFKVIPVFVVETPDVVADRHMKREGRPASKSALSRALTIQTRAEEWRAPFGPSHVVLDYLKSVPHG